jgi:hypothetical protein
VSFATIEDLRSQLGESGSALSPEYRAKQLHELPKTTTVDRAKFILDHCRGKRVLEFGASGPLHDAMVKVAASVEGVDRNDAPGVVGFDLDDVTQTSLPSIIGIELIVCGEVIEHLSNPGWFLTRLRRQYATVPTIITVPNAFAAGNQSWIAKGIENVNKDHVAWYSPKTLSVLLERAGYAVGGLFWYGGNGPTAEGLIVVTE